MTRKEQLIAAIDRSNDSVIDQLWNAFQSMPHEEISSPLNEPETQTILERMGQTPQHFLNNGNLSDRQTRKATIAQHIQNRQASRQ